MIPDFKTYIKESVWNDIRKRGNGTDVKKEDDLNPEEVKQLVNCIEWFATRVVWSQDYEATLDCLCTYIEDFFTKGSKIRVDIPKFINNVKVKWDSFYKGLVKEFINKEKADYMKGTIKESVWNDIRKRGNGTDVKKEDDIEHLDRDGMYDYIYSIYEQNPDVHALPLTSDISGSNQYFSLPMFIFGTALYRLAAHYTNGKISRIILFANAEECEDFYKNLTNTFKVYVKANGSREIKLKDDTVSNQLLLDVIDLITTNSKKPALIKK